MTQFDSTTWESIARRVAFDLHELANAWTPDDVIGVDLLTLLPIAGNANGGGSVQLDSTISVGTVAIANLGSSTVQAQNGALQGGPSLQGTGNMRVAAGGLLSFPLGGDVYSFYGRAGDSIVVARYKSTRDPHAGTLGSPAALNIAGNAAAGAGNLLYTAPFPGVIPAYLTDATMTQGGATINRTRLLGFGGTVLVDFSMGCDTAAIPASSTATVAFASPKLIPGGVLTAVRLTGDAGEPTIACGVC